MWLYNSKEISDTDIPKDALGFLYKIVQISTGKFYYGRKLLTKAKTTQSKGKKIKSRVDSDWKNYWSSSPDLKALIEEQGEADFTREILMFVTTKAALTYGEEYILYVTGSLFHPDCMNQNIRSKIYRKWFAKTPDLQSQLEKIKM